jgi:hypothetical protein
MIIKVEATAVSLRCCPMREFENPIAGRTTDGTHTRIDSRDKLTQTGFAICQDGGSSSRKWNSSDADWLSAQRVELECEPGRYARGNSQIFASRRTSCATRGNEPSF